MIEEIKNNDDLIIDNNKIYFLGIVRSDKWPEDVDKVKKILDNLESQYPFFTFIYMDSSEHINQMEQLFPEGIDYFPVFGVIKNGEIIDVYFGSGIEETKEFLEKYI